MKTIGLLIEDYYYDSPDLINNSSYGELANIAKVVRVFDYKFYPIEDEL